MMDVASVKSSEISSDDLAFRLAPRLNAPGRLGDSDAGLQILTVTEGQEAKELALKVNVANGRRQRLEQSILDRIEDMIRSGGQIADRSNPFFWWGKKTWHRGGFLGIVASRLVERYHRPSLVVGVRDGIATGSGRSIDSFNLYKALSRLTPLFQKFGGHAYAAGFRLDEENLEILKRELEGLAEKEMTEEDLVPTIEVDSDLFLKEIGHEMIDQIAALSPFGQENPEPVFRARSLHVSGSRVVGERHLKTQVTPGRYDFGGNRFSASATTIPLMGRGLI